VGELDLSGWNFAGQNLTNAVFYNALLANADLSQANLVNASFSGATLTDANFTAADMRGSTRADVSRAIVKNTIRPDGVIFGLDLENGSELVVRDDDGVSPGPLLTPRPPIPITIRDHMAISDGGSLRFLFDSDSWDSLFSFEAGIPVTLGGTLKLEFSPDVELQSQIGRTIQLFNWTGVAPTGTFGVVSPYLWDLSQLYTSGEITLIAVPEPSALLLASVAGLGFALVTPRRSTEPAIRDAAMPRRLPVQFSYSTSPGYPRIEHRRSANCNRAPVPGNQPIRVLI
jgi:hypothetical protein